MTLKPCINKERKKQYQNSLKLYFDTNISIRSSKCKMFKKITLSFKNNLKANGVHGRYSLVKTERFNE